MPTTTTSAPSGGRGRAPDPQIRVEADATLTMVFNNQGLLTAKDLQSQLGIRYTRWQFSVLPLAKKIARSDYDAVLVRPIAATGYTFRLTAVWIDPVEYAAIESTHVDARDQRTRAWTMVQNFDVYIAAADANGDRKLARTLRQMQGQANGVFNSLDMVVDQIEAALAAAATNSQVP